MIKSVDIKNIASYDEQGIQVNDLKKINFIYGANACGKTTISNFLYDIQNVDFTDCNVKWENDFPIEVLVYNKNFRERNFGKGKLNGVFTLGEATAEQIKTIDDKNEELKTIKTEGLKKRQTLDIQKKDLENLEDEFREATWLKVYKKNEANFKEAFTGFLKKETFKNKLLQEFSNNKSNLETFSNLKEKSKTIFGETPQSIDLIDEISIARIIEIENHEIWKKIIVGKADVEIAKLIQKLNINDWVNQGRDYIQGETCPFCQEKTITDSLKKQLEEFFDETYLADINLLKNLKQEYHTLLENATNQLNIIETNQKLFSKTKLNVDKFSSYLKTLESQISVNNELINNKSKEPSRGIELASLVEQFNLIITEIRNANAEINKHNNIVNNYTAEKNNLISSIWKYLFEEYNLEITTFTTKKSGIEKGIANLENQLKQKLDDYKKLDAEIKKLNKNVTSIQPTIDEINRKVSDKTAAKRLILIQKEKIFIDKSYLLE